MRQYFQVWKKYAQFSGRAGRREYWVFSLIDLFILVGLFIIYYQGMLHPETGWLKTGFGSWALVYLVYLVGGFLPRLAVTVRRLHDSGKSGFLVLYSGVPIFGIVFVLVMLLQGGDEGENEFTPGKREYGEIFH